MRRFLSMITAALVLLLLHPQYIYAQSNNDADTPEKAGIAEEANPLEITGTFHYVAKSGFYIITGKVRNWGIEPVVHARAKVKFYKKTGEEVLYNEVIVDPTRLAPGQEGGFFVTVGLSQYFDVGKYEVYPGSYAQEKETPYTSLKAAKTQSRDVGDYYQVYATVKNTGDKQAPIYHAIAIFYDSKGNIVTTGAQPVGINFEGLKSGAATEVSFVVAQPNKNTRISYADVVIDFSK